MENNTYNLTELLTESKRYLESLYPNVHDGVQKDLDLLISNIDLYLESKYKNLSEIESCVKIGKLEGRIKYLENELQACNNKVTHFDLQKGIFKNKYDFIKRELTELLTKY